MAAEQHIAENLAAARNEPQDALRKRRLKLWEGLTPEQQVEDWIRDERRKEDYAWRDRYLTRWQTCQQILASRGARYLRCRWQNYVVETPEQATVIEGLRTWADTLAARVRRGEHLLLFGLCGTGKDHVLACLVRQAMLRHGIFSQWVTGPELFRRWRAEFNGGSSVDPGDDKCASGPRPLLVISDPVLPGGTLTPYQAERLYALIDRRSSYQTSTWISVNTTGREDLEQRLGVAIVDRLRDHATTFSFGWPSYRQPLPKVLAIAGPGVAQDARTAAGSTGEPSSGCGPQERR